jgi:hypothetical protein
MNAQNTFKPISSTAKQQLREFAAGLPVTGFIIGIRGHAKGIEDDARRAAYLAGAETTRADGYVNGHQVGLRHLQLFDSRPALVAVLDEDKLINGAARAFMKAAEAAILKGRTLEAAIAAGRKAAHDYLHPAPRRRQESFSKSRGWA